MRGWKATEYPVVGNLHAPISLRVAEALIDEGRVVIGTDGRIWGPGDTLEGSGPFWVGRDTPLTHRQAQAAAIAGAHVRSCHDQRWFVYRYIATKEQWVARLMDPDVQPWQPAPAPIDYGPRHSWYIAWYQRPELVGKEVEVLTIQDEMDEID